MQKETKQKIINFILWVVPVLFLIFGIYGYAKESSVFYYMILIGIGAFWSGIMTRGYFE